MANASPLSQWGDKHVSRLQQEIQNKWIDSSCCLIFNSCQHLTFFIFQRNLKYLCSQLLFQYPMKKPAFYSIQPFPSLPPHILWKINTHTHLLIPNSLTTSQQWLWSSDIEFQESAGMTGKSPHTRTRSCVWNTWCECRWWWPQIWTGYPGWTTPQKCCEASCTWGPCKECEEGLQWINTAFKSLPFLW